MKLERNRAERRSEKGASILYKGIPYLIFAALAAGFLLGSPQLSATSSIAQTDKSTVSIVQRRQFPFAFAGYLGKTNSVLRRGFTEKDFTYTGSKTWIDEGHGNSRIRFLTSGTFTPKKKMVIDAFLVGGGAGGGGNGNTGLLSVGSGGGGGYTATYRTVTLNANQAYPIVIGGGGAQSANGGNTTGFGFTGYGGGAGYKVASSYGVANGGNGGSGGGANGRTSGWVQGGAGGSDGSNGGAVLASGGVGQGATTREFGEAGATLYSGGGGGGSYSNSIVAGQNGNGGGGRGYGGPGGGPTAGTANTGGGGGGGSSDANYYGAVGGSGICVIRNAR
jgi:hypothetical protein